MYTYVYTYVNNSDPKTDPCGTPAKMFYHEDVCSFKTPRCCRFFKYFLSNFSK